MNSFSKFIIKALFVLFTIAMGIALSASTISKQSQSNSTAEFNQITHEKHVIQKAKSNLALKHEQAINMLMPGSNHFNSDFLKKVLFPEFG